MTLLFVFKFTFFFNHILPFLSRGLPNQCLFCSFGIENGQWLFLFAIFIWLHFEMILRNSKSDNWKKTGKTWIKKYLGQWVQNFQEKAGWNSFTSKTARCVSKSWCVSGVEIFTKILKGFTAGKNWLNLATHCVTVVFRINWSQRGSLKWQWDAACAEQLLILIKSAKTWLQRQWSTRFVWSVQQRSAHGK